MAAANKEKKPPLKERNPYAFYRNGFYALVVAKFTSIFLPFIVLFGIKFEEYFKVSTGTTVKMSVGCILALIVGGIALFQSLNRKDEKGNKSPITTVIGWGIGFAFVFLFSSILKDLVLIVGCGFLGQVVGLAFEFGANNRRYYMLKYREARVDSEIKTNEANRKAMNDLLGKKDDTANPVE